MSDGPHQTRETRPSASLGGAAIAACFAMAAFAVAILAGLASGNAAMSVIGRALIAMIVCYPVGMVVTMVWQRVLNEHLVAMRAAVPAHETRAAEATGEPVAQGEVNGDDEEVLVV